MGQEGWFVIAGIAVFFIFIVAIWVAILNSEKKEKAITEEEYNKKIKKPITVGVISIIVIIVSFIGINNAINTIAPDDYEEEDTTPKKYTACENKSDTYHKCKWSISEDRCVCKQR